MAGLMGAQNDADQISRVDELRAEFGELLTLKDLAKLLRYPSVRAIQKARLRGTLDIPFMRIVGRRGWFAPIRGVAEYLKKIDMEISKHTACGLPSESPSPQGKAKRRVP